MFKWVEDAVLEEVEEALPKIARLEAEVAKGKSDVEDLKGVITELMEEVVTTRKKLKRCEVQMKIVCVVISLISIGVVVSLKN